MASTTTITKKPKRPCSVYNLFYQLERECLLHERVPHRARDRRREIENHPSFSLSTDHSLRPRRYRHLVLRENWYKSGVSHRAHRKSIMPVGFLEFNKMVSKLWREVDVETKEYLGGIYEKEMAVYREAKKVYAAHSRKNRGEGKREGESRDDGLERGIDESDGGVKVEKVPEAEEMAATHQIQTESGDATAGYENIYFSSHARLRERTVGFNGNSCHHPLPDNKDGSHIILHSHSIPKSHKTHPRESTNGTNFPLDHRHPYQSLWPVAAVVEELRRRGDIIDSGDLDVGQVRVRIDTNNRHRNHHHLHVHGDFRFHPYAGNRARSEETTDDNGPNEARNISSRSFKRHFDLTEGLDFKPWHCNDIRRVSGPMERPPYEREIAADDPTGYFHGLDEVRRFRRESLDVEQEWLQNRLRRGQLQMQSSLPAVMDDDINSTKFYNQNIFHNNNNQNMDYMNNCKIIDFDSDFTTNCGGAFLPEFQLRLKGQQQQLPQRQLQQHQQCPDRVTAMDMTTEFNACPDSMDEKRATHHPVLPSRRVTNMASSRQSTCDAATAATGTAADAGPFPTGPRDRKTRLRRRGDFDPSGVLTSTRLHSLDVPTLVGTTVPNYGEAYGNGYVSGVETFSEMDERDVLLQRKIRILEWHRDQLLHQQRLWEQQKQWEKQLLRQELLEQQQRDERRLREVNDRSRDSAAEAEDKFDSDRRQNNPDGEDLYTICQLEPQPSQEKEVEEGGDDEDENRGVEFVQVPLRVESDEFVPTDSTGHG